MSSFSDKEHAQTQLMFHGERLLDIDEHCSEAIRAALTDWQNRQELHDPAPQPMQLPETQSFVIDYQGKASDHFPDAKSNYVAEALVREFLFNDGLCQVDSLTPTLHAASFKVEALDDVEYLLVCPFPTQSGNVGGAVIVCVNRHLTKR